MSRSKPRRNPPLPSFLRFLIVGGLGTLLSYSIYVVLSLSLDAWVAFSVAYFAGLLFNVLLGSRWVFKSGNGTRSVIKFGGLHLFSYLVGRLIIFGLDPIGISEILISAVLIATVTTPINFFGGRSIFGQVAGSSTKVSEELEEIR